MPRDFLGNFKDSQEIIAIPIAFYLAFLALIAFILLVLFAPGIEYRFGFLGERKEQQKSLAQTPVAPPPGDSDQDGFSDVVEKWIKTDPQDNCADNLRDAAWPPDFNNDKLVNQTDLDMLKKYFGQRVMGENNRRYDLNADKTINLEDVYLFRPYFNKGCPFHFLKATIGSPAGKGYVIFSWTPAIVETRALALIDLTKISPTPVPIDCNSIDSYRKYAIDNAYLSVGSTSKVILATPESSGHKFCAAIAGGEPSPSLNQYLASNVVTFTLPAPTPTPTPIPTPITISQPSCTLTANPNSITAGSSTSLAWFTKNAISAYIFPSPTGTTAYVVPTDLLSQGALSITPRSTTTYTMYVYNSTQTSATCSVIVYVITGTATPGPTPTPAPIP